MERRPVFFGAAHPLAEDPIDESVYSGDCVSVCGQVRIRDARHLRRHVRREEVADDVGAFEVQHRQVGKMRS